MHACNGDVHRIFQPEVIDWVPTDEEAKRFALEMYDVSPTFREWLVSFMRDRVEAGRKMPLADFM